MGITGISSYSQGHGAATNSSASGSVSAAQSSTSAESAKTQTSSDPKGIRLPEDRVTLSGETPEEAKKPKPDEKTTADGKSLEDPQVKQVIAQMKANEEKVKAHEAAHKAVGGNLASSATYSYSQGPDGHSYITGGEVQIDMSGGKTPEETISKMQQVIRAALAPVDPSGQDRAVAAAAASQMAQAQQQKARESNPTAKPEPGQEVDPVEEALKKALDPAKDDEKSTDTATGLKLQRSYGISTGQSDSSTGSIISSFA